MEPPPRRGSIAGKRSGARTFRPFHQMATVLTANAALSWSVPTDAQPVLLATSTGGPGALPGRLFRSGLVHGRHYPDDVPELRRRALQAVERPAGDGQIAHRPGRRRADRERLGTGRSADAEKRSCGEDSVLKTRAGGRDRRPFVKRTEPRITRSGSTAEAWGGAVEMRGSSI